MSTPTSALLGYPCYTSQSPSRFYAGGTGQNWCIAATCATPEGVPPPQRHSTHTHTASALTNHEHCRADGGRRRVHTTRRHRPLHTATKAHGADVSVFADVRDRDTPVDAHPLGPHPSLRTHSHCLSTAKPTPYSAARACTNGRTCFSAMGALGTFHTTRQGAHTLHLGCRGTLQQPKTSHTGAYHGCQ